MTSGKRVAEPPQNSYQPRDTSQLSRQATTGKMRKGKQSKKAMADKEELQREEIRFNLTYPFRDTRSGASARRRQEGLREDGDSSDYPPPPAYEVATSPTLSSLTPSALASSTFVAGVHMHPEHSSFANRTPSSGSTQPTVIHDNVIMHTDAVTPTLTGTSAIPGTVPTLSPLTIPGSISSPRPPARNIAQGSCTFPPARHKALLDDDESSSIELVDIDPSQRWEMDRQRGIPLEERATRHHHLVAEPHAPVVPQRSRLFSQAPKRSPTSQSRFANSRLSLRIPEDQDPYPDDSTQAESVISSPATPKHKLPIPSLPLSPSRIFHRSQSPQPSTSVISLLRNPSPFFKSTPSLLNLSSPSTIHSGHGEQHLSRKLFHRKQKERARSENLEDWEVLDRTDSSHSSLEECPVRPRTPSPAPASGSAFVETWPYPEVSTEGTHVSTAHHHHPYHSNVQNMPSVDEHPQRPSSPPFVNRHVRRRTSSSLRSDSTSAPVSPISAYSASLFSSSSLSLATVGRTLPFFSQQDHGVCEESERSHRPTRGITLRDSPSLSTLSLSQPSVGRGLTSFSQVDLSSQCIQHDNVRSPRTATPIELPMTPRMPTRVSPVAEVTYINYNATSDEPSTPAPNNSLPTRSATERVSRRRTTARREEILIHRGRSLSRDLGIRNAPAYSAIFPLGPPTPPPESHTPPLEEPRTPSLKASHTPPLEESHTTSPEEWHTPPQEESHTPPYSPTPTSPRRHYAGRPLPQTPSTSPSLTWLVGRPGLANSTLSNVLHHPRAIPQSPHVPEGLLIDLDDDSLDQCGPSDGNHASSVHAHTPPLPNRTPPLPDHTPMVPDRTPAARTPPPLPIDYLEDDIDDSLTVCSSSPRGPLTPTSAILPSSSNFSSSPSMRTLTPPTPEYITGLVGSLEDDSARDDGSDYDALLLISDFIGPAILRRNPDDLVDCLVGRVEMERRRVTSDGRVKVKLSLLGVNVQKCAICMSRFKSGDHGVLGGKCRHAFHKKCLIPWLATNQTCPLCRERLDVQYQ